jgi:hypothetical protein
MSGHDLVQVWKDPYLRGGDVIHPSGEIELDLEAENGGNSEDLSSAGCCGGVMTLLHWCCTVSASLALPGTLPICTIIFTAA